MQEVQIRAMTLVESLVSLGLLSLGILLALQLWPQTLIQQRQLSNRSWVLSRAHYALDEAVGSSATMKDGQYPLKDLKLPDGTDINGKLLVGPGATAGTRNFEVVLAWSERGLNLECRLQRRKADVQE